MTEPDDDYLWGAMFHGRGPFVIWHDSRREALLDAESVEDKHAPAELVRVRLNSMELSGKYFYAEENGERRWHSKAEALRDQMLP